MLTIIIGIVSFVSVTAVSKTANDYAENVIPATSYLLNARRTIRNFQVDILESTAVMTEEEFDAVLASMESDRVDFFNYLDQLIRVAPQFSDDVQQIRTDMDAAAIIREKILAESEKRTTEGNAKAFEIYKAEYQPALEKVTTALSGISDVVNAEITETYTASQTNQTVITVVIFSVIGIAIVVVICITLALTKMIVTPMKEIETAMDNISFGRISEAKVEYTSKDELGSLADSTRRTVTFFQNVMPDIAKICNNLGDGNFTVTSTNLDFYVGETEEILKSMRYTRDSLNDALSQVETASDQLLGGAGQVASASQSLAQGATEQASSVEELAATLSELSDKVHKTADNAQTAQSYSSEASDGVKESTEHMHELIKAMDDINNASNEISQIIKAIEDISFQTKILAMNAAIDAARQRQAGKGFAVVADEVRNLAGKSAEAAHNTTELIENSLRAVQAGMQQVSATSASLDNVVFKEAQVAEMVSAITNATVEQSEAITQITLGVDQISDVVQTNSATSEEAAAAAEELSSQANMLKELVGKFNLVEK